ncbi:MAG: alpha/beta hydrolase [Alphaproteobacteria bacterium]|nr:MAG: alpha/beta hydrolase [Alphaproteobacteria bacterium]
MRRDRVWCLSEAGFHRMAYVEWRPQGRGAEGAAPTVICVHGLTRTGRDFDLLAADLAAAGLRVVCPDVVGRGMSDWLVDPAAYGYPQYMADMTVLIARTGAEVIDWVGTSMGGLIGMMLAAQPDTPIRRLVLNDVGPFIPAAALARIADYVGGDPRFDDMAAAESYIRKVHASFGPLRDAHWRHLTATSIRTAEDGSLRLHYDPAIARPFRDRAPEDVDLWTVWDAIRCPVLVLRGAESDLLRPDTAAEMTRRGPRARVVEIPDAGHAPALMDRGQIAVVRDWLTTA